MFSQLDANYRQLVTLADGARVLLRLLTKTDRQGLLDLYSPVTEDDQRYMRQNVRDPKLIESWVDDLDYDKVLPLVALFGDRIVGNSTLHFGSGPTRHVAELRIFLPKDFRRRGLGTKMLQAQIDLAKRRNLHFLMAQIVSDQTNVIKAFQQVGFERKCTLENYHMLPDGDLRDTVIVSLALRASRSEF
jgi:L-amino acid N-acyltransferase YncA